MSTRQTRYVEVYGSLWITLYWGMWDVLRPLCCWRQCAPGLHLSGRQKSIDSRTAGDSRSIHHDTLNAYAGDWIVRQCTLECVRDLAASTIRRDRRHVRLNWTVAYSIDQTTNSPRHTVQIHHCVESGSHVPSGRSFAFATRDIQSELLGTLGVFTSANIIWSIGEWYKLWSLKVYLVSYFTAEQMLRTKWSLLMFSLRYSRIFITIRNS